MEQESQHVILFGFLVRALVGPPMRALFLTAVCEGIATYGNSLFIGDAPLYVKNSDNFVKRRTAETS